MVCKQQATRYKSFLKMQYPRFAPACLGWTWQDGGFVWKVRFMYYYLPVWQGFMLYYGIVLFYSWPDQPYRS